MENLRNLLTRQIPRTIGEDYHLPEECLSLLLLVNDSYQQYERDRTLVERAMELSSQEFVKKNNGKIWVESDEMKGSKFKFTLPLKEGKPKN